MRPRQSLAGSYITQIVTGGKAPPRAPQNNTTNAVRLASQSLHMGLKILKNLDIEAIELIGSIKGQERQPICIVTRDSVRH